jgi:hypothetical protein
LRNADLNKIASLLIWSFNPQSEFRNPKLIRFIMNSLQSKIGRVLGLALLLALSVSSIYAQGATGSLRGTVTDELGGIIVGATVTATDASGVSKNTVTNGEGVYVLSGLAPGKYSVRAESSGFAAYENAEVEVAAGRRDPLNIQLKVTIAEEKVTVASETPVSTEAQDNADQVVLRGKDLDSLPDDPDELAAALQALAGPSAGPNGGQIFIDGFTGGRIPPKASIREIRVNQNPFAAENDQPAGGRIDIFTKPGTDKLRGSAFFNFNDESMNSRNPFSSNRPPFQFRQYGGSLSGPIIPKKASYFIDFERRETDDNEVVNAFVLDPSLNVAQIQQGFVVPRRVITFSPRFDYQLNDRHTLVARYSFNHFSTQNGGIGGFSLPERAFDSANTQHNLQLTETAIISPTVINETRFQYTHQHSEQNGNNTVPTVNVLQSFTSGGSQVGLASNNDDRWELQNYTSWSVGHHALKAGGRLRGVHIRDVSPNNFGGTYVFAGGLAPVLNANNNPVLIPDPNNAGNSVAQLQTITSLDRYRRTLVLQQLGFTQAQILARGGGPTQFNINLGNPEATVSQFDLGGFIQDDWRVRPNLTFSFGLRYEAQTNISSKFNFAPRVAFAWSPSSGNAARPPKTVVRGGGGIFYNRFGESNTLQSNRFNGVNQLQFTASDAATLANIPFPTSADPASLDVSNLNIDPSRQITWRVAQDLRTPTFYMLGGQLEHQLPLKFTMFAGVFGLRIEHAIRARDINAPLPGTFFNSTNPALANPGIRPFGNIGEIYQYESSGTFKQKQLFIGFNNRLNPAFSMFSSYVLSKTESDTDGQGGGLFPANSYDLSNEFGRAGNDVRHRFTLAGTLTLPWYKISLNPFIIATSGRPFNITTGRDINGDNLFLERPAFAGANVNCADRTNYACTPFGNFKLNPGPGDEIIPRNFGHGPGFFSVNMRVSKTWNFGDVHSSNAKNAAPATSPQGSAGAEGGRGPGREGAGGGARGGAGGGPGGGGPGGIPGFNPGRGGGGGQGGGLAGGGPEKRYSLTFSVNFQNLFNHNNRATPIGNLSSPLFGESTSTAGGFGGFGPGGSVSAGNRRVQAQIRFNF